MERCTSHTISTNKKILKYMRFNFGSKIIIPESKVQEIGGDYIIPEFGV